MLIKINVKPSLSNSKQIKCRKIILLKYIVFNGFCFATLQPKEEEEKTKNNSRKLYTLPYKQKQKRPKKSNSSSS